MTEWLKIMAALVLCGMLVSCGSALDTDSMSDADPAETPLGQKAMAGDRDAQFQLGNTFCCGRDGGLNTDEAIRWWCLAAIQKHPGAIEALKKHDPGKTCPI